MDGRQHEVFMNDMKDLTAFLVKLSESRGMRGNGVPCPEWMVDRGHTMEWNVFEVESMTNRINEIRESRGLEGNITLTEVSRKDLSASGHCDYAHKFGLYCAELVHGINRS